MTLSELNTRAIALRDQIAKRNAEMDKIHDEQKIVAHSKAMMPLIDELKDIDEQINKAN